jgi:hypothetical protein
MSDGAGSRRPSAGAGIGRTRSTAAGGCCAAASDPQPAAVGPGSS